MAPLTILIADDHAVVRRGLSTLIASQPGWTVVAEVDNGTDAVEQAKRTKPDIAILDITMPRMDGLAATRAIHKELPETKILGISMLESDMVSNELFAAGASGYVSKTDAAREIVSAIEAVSEGRQFVSQRLNPQSSFLPFGTQHRSLTAREVDVMRCLADGMVNEAVAERLHISSKTVSTHRSNIMRKLEIHSITELVRYAVRNGIISK